MRMKKWLSLLLVFAFVLSLSSLGTVALADWNGEVRATEESGDKPTPPAKPTPKQGDPTPTPDVPTPTPDDPTPTPDDPTPSPTDETKPGGNNPTPTIGGGKHEAVTGAGRVIVVTGPVKTIEVKDFQDNVIFSASAEGGISTQAGLAYKKSHDAQYEITLPGDEHAYSVSVTAMPDGPVGLSVYLFGEDEGTPERIYALEEGCVLAPEDTLMAEIAADGSMTARRGESLGVKSLSGGECGLLSINLKIRIRQGEYYKDQPVDPGEPINHYGEVARFEAEMVDGLLFESWLDPNGTVLGTDPVLYYFITGETTLTAQYREADSGVTVTTEEPGGEEGGISTGLLIVLIAGGAVLLGGLTLLIVLLAGRNKRGNDRRYPPVQARNELRQAAPTVAGGAAAAQARPRPMSNRAAAIQVHQGPMAGRTVPIRPGQTLTVGRSESCDVVFDSSYLSRTHCKVRFDPATDKYIVTDLGVNGTYFADKRRLPQGRDVAVDPGTKLLLSGNECTITLK